MPIGVDLTELPLAVRQKMQAVLTDEHAAQIVAAKIRQQRLAQFYHNNEPRSIDGMGGLEMAVDPFWISYFNMMHGRQVWADGDFRKWVNKQEDWFKVRSKGTKVMVGWAASGARPVFRKTYAEAPK